MFILPPPVLRNVCQNPAVLIPTIDQSLTRIKKNSKYTFKNEKVLEVEVPPTKFKITRQGFHLPYTKKITNKNSCSSKQIKIKVEGEKFPI